MSQQLPVGWRMLVLLDSLQWRDYVVCISDYWSFYPNSESISEPVVLLDLRELFDTIFLYYLCRSILKVFKYLQTTWKSSLFTLFHLITSHVIFSSVSAKDVKFSANFGYFFLKQVFKSQNHGMTPADFDIHSWSIDELECKISSVLPRCVNPQNMPLLCLPLTIVSLRTTFVAVKCFLFICIVSISSPDFGWNFTYGLILFGRWLAWPHCLFLHILVSQQELISC